MTSKSNDKGKWTSGPWHVGTGWIYQAADKTGLPGRKVCTIGVTPQDDANAELIAAAPELYAALQRLIEWEDCGCDPSAKAIERAREVLAKARGEAK